MNAYLVRHPIDTSFVQINDSEKIKNPAVGTSNKHQAGFFKAAKFAITYRHATESLKKQPANAGCHKKQFDFFTTISGYGCEF